MHDRMTETLPSTRNLVGVTIRAYRPSDHSAGRRLWGELTEHRARLYGDPSLAGDDPGAGFEEYLTQLNLSGMWVADHEEEGVCGFIGLRLDGREGEVEPVVVTAALRGRGIGRALLARVVDEARRRGLARLTVSPSVRDVSALHTLHAAGFGTVSTVTLVYAVRGGTEAPSGRGETLDLFDLHFGV
jgi:GNAT superfamily N-acetyltransferase